MPKFLKRSAQGCIPAASQYTCGQVAFLMQVSHRTAAKMIDNGTIKGYRMMSGKRVDLRERRVLHSALVNFIEEYPDYGFMLDRLENYDPRVDFGKDYEQRWKKKLHPRKPRVKILQELDSQGLASGLVHESSEETEPRLK